MSRSYKKNPIIKDKNKGLKKIANKKIKYSNDVQSSSRALYKKYFQSYDICDWSFSFSYNQFLKFYKLGNNKKNYKYWFIRYKSK